MNYWNKDVVNAIERKIGYTFNNKKLLKQAFTRESYVIEHDNTAASYQVLEFIGDRILDIIVVRLLTAFMGNKNCQILNDKVEEDYYFSTLKEGDLSMAKAQLVNKNALSKAMDKLALKQFILMGAGEIDANIQDTPSAKEDLFEAILGSVAIDSNWDFVKLTKVLREMYEGLGDFIRKTVEEPLSCDTWENEFPESEYKIDFIDCGLVDKGWDKPNKDGLIWHPVKNHKVILNIFNKANVLEHSYYGYGQNRNEAETMAQRNAIIYKNNSFDEQPLLKATEKANIENAFNVVHELFQKKIIEKEEYYFDGPHVDSQGFDRWHVILNIPNFGISEIFNCGSKKDAKKMVAQYAIQKMRESFMSRTALVPNIYGTTLIDFMGNKGKILKIVIDKTGKEMAYKVHLDMGKGVVWKYNMKDVLETAYESKFRPLIREIVSINKKEQVIKKSSRPRLGELGLVRHAVYGEGEIVEIVNENQVEVKFKNRPDHIKHYYTVEYLLNNFTMPHKTLNKVMKSFEKAIPLDIKNEYIKYCEVYNCLKKMTLPDWQYITNVDIEFYPDEGFDEFDSDIGPYGYDDIDRDYYDRIDYSPWDETDYNPMDDDSFIDELFN